MEQKPLNMLNRAAYAALGLTLLPWLVKLLEWYLGVSWAHYGLYPRDFRGLTGIFTLPFLHANWAHLLSNSAPLLVLGTALFFFFRQVAWKVILWGWLLTGILTWIIANKGYHIGASGMVYTLASFIFWNGVFKRHRPLMALSLLVIFIYGGLIWGLMPLQPDVSWEGHLAGFISGLYLSWRYKGVPYVFEPPDEPEEEETDEYPYWMEGAEEKEDKDKQG